MLYFHIGLASSTFWNVSPYFFHCQEQVALNIYIVGGNFANIIVVCLQVLCKADRVFEFMALFQGMIC